MENTIKTKTVTLNPTPTNWLIQMIRVDKATSQKRVKIWKLTLKRQTKIAADDILIFLTFIFRRK